MRATLMHGTNVVRVETVPDARLIEPTDALVLATRASIAAAVSGPATRWRQARDLVVAPFAWSDGTCEFCQQGLQTSCLHGGWWGVTLDGGQGEGVRVPQADGTLVVLHVGPDHALVPSL